MADIEAHVRGLGDLADALRALGPKFRSRAILNALRAGGRAFRDEARRLAPVLRVPIRRRNQVREVGTLKRAISVRTSKQAKRQGDLGVFVNVRPVKGAQRGSKSGKDPFYWLWNEFDHYAGGRRAARVAVRRPTARRLVKGKAFLRGALSRGAEAMRRIVDGLGAEIKKFNTPK